MRILNVYCRCLQQFFLTIVTISFALLQKCSYLMEFVMIFWWYFSVNYLQLVYFQDKLCLFVSVVPFQLVKIANRFWLKCAISWRRKDIFLKHFCFSFTLGKILAGKVQKHSGCKLWLRCNRQKNDYLRW